MNPEIAMKTTKRIERTLVQPVLLMTFLYGLTSPAFAVKVGWHDQMSIQVGDGVDLKRQSEPVTHLAIMGTNASVVPNTGGVSETVNFAQHVFDMVKSLSVNSSVSLDYLVFSGDVDVSFIGQQSFNANTLNFVFTATRNFGDTIYPVVDFSPDFKKTVTTLQQSLQGEALHAAITRVFGTHYVHGYQSAAMVSVVYSFHYKSASTALQLSVNSGGSFFDLASFSVFVDSFFSSTDTTKTMSYQFYSTDPFVSPTNFNFSTAGDIQSTADFTNLVTKVEAYWRAMDPAHGKVTGYILDPIQSLPGYLPLLAGYAPVPVFSSDYDTFLKVYAQLLSWNQRLTDWTLDPKKMSWLNVTGQQMARGKRLDIANYVAALKAIGINHFQNGAPLTVPADVFNYLATLSDIPIPAIYVLDSFLHPSGAWHYVIGWVDCGTLDLTTAQPFNAISQFYKGAEIGAGTGWWGSIYSSPEEFSAFYTGNKGVVIDAPVQNHMGVLVASQTWRAVTNQAATRERIGFFVVSSDTANAPESSLSIRDLEGNTVDEIPFLSTRSGGIPASLTASRTGNVSLAPGPVTGTAAAGVVRPIPMTVTNNGPTPVYGAAVSFKLDNGFAFADASGTQGYASFDPSTRMVAYTIGPLLGGARADIALRLIPLQTGMPLPSPLVQLTLGDGLTNISANSTATFWPIPTLQPRLNLAPVGGGVQLNWQSDTDRLLVERTSALGTSATWSMVTNTPVRGGSDRFLNLPAVDRQNYFRLRIQ